MSHLLGFGDFEVGATKPAAKSAAKGKPTGKLAAKVPKSKIPSAYPTGKANTDVKKHKGALKKGFGALQKANATVKRGRQALARKTAAPKGKPVPRLPSGKPLVGLVYVGAEVAKKLSPKAALAVKKYNEAVLKSREVAKKLAKGLMKTRSTAKGLAKQMVAQRNQMKQLRAGGKTVRLGDLIHTELGEEVLGALAEYYDTVGADPDPANPGFLTDGSPDPAFSDPSLTDEGLTDEAAPGLQAIDILNAAADLGPAPDMNTFVKDSTDPSIPAIPYDGSKGTPDGFAGSYGLFVAIPEDQVKDRKGTMGSINARSAPYFPTRITDIPVEPTVPGIDGNDHFGFVFGKYEWDTPLKGLGWGADFPSGKWVHVHGRHGLRGWTDSWEVVSPEQAAKSMDFKNRNGDMYGPLVGNPLMADFARMRIDGNGKMFWYAQEAPEWLTAPIRMAAKLTEVAAQKLLDDQRKADELAAEKEKRDNEAAMRAQEAANALAESQEASAAKVAQSQTETQAQQALVAQQQQETTEKAQTAETEKAASELLLQQTKQQMEEEKQAGELLLAQAKREQEQGPAQAQAEGGEEGYAEDEGGFGDEGAEGDAAEADEGGFGDEGGDEYVGHFDTGYEYEGY